jgi:large subunit ribosomal protein L9
MQVVLVKDVERFGKKGDTKRVTEGYARNFLFPRHLAVVATDGAKKHLELMKVSWTRHEAREKEAANELAKKLQGMTFRITKKSGDKGRLFGSVTNTEVAEMIHREAKVTIDKKSITVDHIKELGQHEVTVKLAPEVKATVKIVVMAEEGAAA